MKRKFVYRQKDGVDVLVVDSGTYVNPDYSGRVHITIQDTSQLAFSFVINQLQLTDTGTYFCQAGDDDRADKTYAALRVLKPEPELAYGDLRGSVTFDCALGPEVAKLHKFLCRVRNGQDCEVVVNTLGERAQAFEGRVLLTHESSNLFHVHVTGLRREDAGHYLCGAHASGKLQEGWPVQAWQLFVNEGET